MTNPIEQILVPDLGGAENVEVIEVLVKAGDAVAKDDSLITLESDKASMDVPAPFAGSVKEIQIKVGDKVAEGTKILTIEVGEAQQAATVEKPKLVAVEPAQTTEQEVRIPAPEKAPLEIASHQTPEPEEPVVATTEAAQNFGTSVHAGPAVRRIAREFGVNLTKIHGSAAKGRIVKEDVQQFVKSQLQIAEKSSAGGITMVPAPKVDFSRFGEIETKPLSKIKKLTGVNLSRNWVTVPHVTQFEEADITETEAFRQNQKKQALDDGIRLTPLVFIMKAVVGALKEYPSFNASLDATGENLILKKYFHIGVAVDTPGGLVVPVIRDVDKKGLFELAKELGAISEKARNKGLGITDMQGGCFSISSLGGIGGTAFTPIINAPEVAILGVSKMQWKSLYDSKNNCRTRLMLPLSLSYDHRVIDGAQAARFVVFLANRLADIRTLLL